MKLLLLQGRNLETKRKLDKEIFRNLKASSGIDEDDILLYLNEPELENWGIKGKPDSEIDMRFEIKV